MEALRRLTYEEILGASEPTGMIGAMLRGLSRPVSTPPRQHLTVGLGTILLMPAWQSEELIAVKVATVFPHNQKAGLPTVQGEILVFSAKTGMLLASLDGRAVTLLRTAAVVALAADKLSPVEISSLLMIGTGSMTMPLLEALVAVRRFERIEIWGRNGVKAEQIARAARLRSWPARAVSNLDRAISAASIVISATSANDPLIKAPLLKEDAHLGLVGGFTPSMQEAEPECFANAYVVADTPEAIVESGDLIRPIERGFLAPDDVNMLVDVATAGPIPLGRGQRTIFKSVGSAAFDLFAAAYLLDAPSP